MPPGRQKPGERGADVTWDALLARLLAAKREDCGAKHLYDLENSLGRAHKGLIALGCPRPIMITKDLVRQFLADYLATLSRGHSPAVALMRLRAANDIADRPGRTRPRRVIPPAQE